MRLIELYTAHADKNGVRREAGEILNVGDTKTADILPDDAKALVARAGAAEVRSASSAVPKRSTKKRAAKPSAKPSAPAAPVAKPSEG